MHEFALSVSLSLFSFASHCVASPQFFATFSLPAVRPHVRSRRVLSVLQKQPPVHAARGAQRQTNGTEADYPAVSSTMVTQQPVLTQIYRLLCATILIQQSDAIKVLSAMSVHKAAGNIPLLHLQHTFTGRLKKKCFCVIVLILSK